MKALYSLTAAALVVVAAPASAATVIVSNVAGLPSKTAWGTYPGENNAGSTAAVTSTVAYNGNGSLEMRGDRTRTQLGIQFTLGRTDIGALADVSALTFDWRVAADSTNPYNADYTPALRLLILDGSTRKELIWEGAYNGTYGKTTRDTWYSTTSADKFYITGGNENDGQMIASWASQLTGARVLGMSVGVGGGLGKGYHAFADNVTLTTSTGSTTYNFDLKPTATVPEPGTWLMMMLGFGVVGAACRRRTRVRVALG
ncbi:PEPxxWA-CTERM sorting domain-containing protein [Sphingomonas phyllosphaerae]|uniref:PEPxxWA-CTERM sorting domain-containing protein n=1 Tax=Sphingomonas phyllosphaerae TaxID=257003 RepID=UPI0004132C98|nr:PEPxxWA-CTERM sorting domain-containing protein [Sphingomonas phyllosphaerae]